MKHLFLALGLLFSIRVWAFSQASVQFIVDENYLAIQTIAKSANSAHGLYAEDVEVYRLTAKDIDPQSFQRVQSIYKNKGMKILFGKIDSEFKNYVSKLKKTPEFSKVLVQTKEYAVQGESEWNKNLAHTSELMNWLTGFDFSKTSHVYISHPAVGSGTTWDFENSNISFGAWPIWNDYFTVYVWHELLHLQMPLDDKAHAIIQLATDCWLRAQLNGMTYPPLEGHLDLFPKMEIMMPSWKKYLQQPSGLLNYYNSSI